jgi:hypothetical protein
MNYDSVDSFLKACHEAKSPRRQAIREGISDHLNDPDTIGIPAGLGITIEKLIEKYGDEVLRSVALWSLGKWAQLHCNLLQQRKFHGDAEAIALTAGDLSLIRHTIRTAAEVGSFGGDTHWREMLKDNLGQAVLEGLEELDCQGESEDE